MMTSQMDMVLLVCVVGCVVGCVVTVVEGGRRTRGLQLGEGSRGERRVRGLDVEERNRGSRGGGRRNREKPSMEFKDCGE